VEHIASKSAARGSEDGGIGPGSGGSATMRRVIVIEFVTLDGVIQGPGGPEEDTNGGFAYGGWVRPYAEPTQTEVIRRQMNLPFDLLLGRRTFEIWADDWPQRADAWPGAAAATKYVVSTTLTSHAWQPAVFIDRDVAERIAVLRREPGPDLHVYGSTVLVGTLLAHYLVDALWPKTHPIVLGGVPRYPPGREAPTGAGHLRVGVVHPRLAPQPCLVVVLCDVGLQPVREVDAAFQHGTAKNWFGGTSRASTQLLDGMHYRGLLRVARREGGVRLYAPQRAHEHEAPEDPEAHLDALIDVAVGTYAPLTATMLSRIVMWMGAAAAPQWRERRRSALERAKARLAKATVDGSHWYWPADERPTGHRHAHDRAWDEQVRLLAPFDPVVWDRERFERFWGWSYRFEAYTPARKRLRAYYALPMLWRGRVIGWANAAVRDGRLQVEPGFVSGSAPREAAFRQALAAEVERFQQFLGS